MNRKKTLLSLGLLYGICGIGAGAICYGQSDYPTTEVAAVTEECEESSTWQTENEQSEVTESTEEVIETTTEAETEQTTETEQTEEPTVEESTVTEEPVKQYMATAVNVGTSRLMIRDAASMQGEIIGFMKNGNTVEVIEVGEEWHLIRFHDIEGYSSAKYLELTEIQEESTEER